MISTLGLGLVFVSAIVYIGRCVSKDLDLYEGSSFPEQKSKKEKPPV